MLVLVDLIVGQVVTLFLVYKEAESDIYIYEIIRNNFPLFSFSLSLSLSMCDSTIVVASSLCLISTPSLLVLGPETYILSKGWLKDM